jgi:hypothetical protein
MTLVMASRDVRHHQDILRVRFVRRSAPTCRMNRSSMHWQLLYHRREAYLDARPATTISRRALPAPSIHKSQNNIKDKATVLRRKQTTPAGTLPVLLLDESLNHSRLGSALPICFRAGPTSTLSFLSSAPSPSFKMSVRRLHRSHWRSHASRKKKSVAFALEHRSHAAITTALTHWTGLLLQCAGSARE